MFKKFQSLPSGEQSYYLVQMEKLLEGKYELTSIQEPRFPKSHNFRGRPKGSLNKLNSHKSKTSSKRDPSAFEYAQPKRKRGRPQKISKKNVTKKIESKKDEKVFYFLRNVPCSGATQLFSAIVYLSKADSFKGFNDFFLCVQSSTLDATLLEFDNDVVKKLNPNTFYDSRRPLSSINVSTSISWEILC